MAGKSENSISSRPLSVNRNDLWETLVKAQAELGLVITQPAPDGRLHRCPLEGGRKGSLDGAYKVNPDPPANLWAMNFKTGLKKVYLFGASSSGPWSPAERRAWAAKCEDDRKAREAAQLAAWAVAAQKAELIYTEAGPCQGHPYLNRKGVQPHFRLKVSDRDLVVPLFNAAGELRSLQFIDPAGQKRFLKGGQKAGCFLTLKAESTDQGQPLVVCEGLATGLSLFQSTGLEVLVAFDAGGLKAVALGARRDWPERVIILGADNDSSGGSGNIGVTKAKEAALAAGGLLSIPFMVDGHPCDFNDLHQAEGPETVRAFVEAAFDVKEGLDNA
ncbi:MAG: toprim domain-containing protein [Candidatus Adiutrix sp.]|nr:toprim domain-containing protein [Candidatus Adiutrix sp.]